MYVNGNLIKEVSRKFYLFNYLKDLQKVANLNKYKISTSEIYSNMKIHEENEIYISNESISILDDEIKISKITIDKKDDKSRNSNNKKSSKNNDDKELIIRCTFFDDVYIKSKYSDLKEKDKSKIISKLTFDFQLISINMKLCNNLNFNQIKETKNVIENIMNYNNYQATNNMNNNSNCNDININNSNKLNTGFPRQDKTIKNNSLNISNIIHEISELSKLEHSNKENDYNFILNLSKKIYYDIICELKNEISNVDDTNKKKNYLSIVETNEKFFLNGSNNHLNQYNIYKDKNHEGKINHFNSIELNENQEIVNQQINKYGINYNLSNKNNKDTFFLDYCINSLVPLMRLLFKEKNKKK